MSTTSKFSMIGCVHKFLLAAERAGLTPELLNSLAEDDTGVLADMLAVAEGRAEVRERAINTIIDLNQEAAPVNGFSPFCHRLGGSMDWRTSSICVTRLTLPWGEKAESIARLTALRALNSNVLEFLLRNPSLIPKNWRNTGFTYYFGTTYNVHGKMNFRGMCCRKGKWESILCDGRPDGPKDRFVC